jgi:hypothetical protein
MLYRNKHFSQFWQCLPGSHTVWLMMAYSATVMTLWAQDLWQMWLALCPGWGTHFAGLSAWTACLTLAFAHSTASWSSHAPQYEDSPTRLRTFINQPGIYGVASFLTECLVALFSGNFLVPFWLGFRLFQSFRSEAPQRHVWRCNLTSPYLNLQPL